MRYGCLARSSDYAVRDATTSVHHCARVGGNPFGIVVILLWENIFKLTVGGDALSCRDAGGVTGAAKVLYAPRKIVWR